MTIYYLWIKWEQMTHAIYNFLAKHAIKSKGANEHTPIYKYEELW